MRLAAWTFHAPTRLRRFHIPPLRHWFLGERGVMSRVPRFIGYALMVAAALVAVVMKRDGVENIGPLPAVAVALFLGMVGVMLVFTDLMVRGLYAQVGAAKAAAGDEETKGDDDV